MIMASDWSDEAYPVFVHPPSPVTPAHDPVAFAIERAALPLFSFVNFGALLIGELGFLDIAFSPILKQYLSDLEL